MQRDQWTWTYNILDVLRGAEERMRYHESRMAEEREQYGSSSMVSNAGRHQVMVEEYSKWVAVLSGRLGELELDRDDIQFFFPDEAEPVTGDTPA